ncbi:MAG: GNAT family N-acetyltransferase [Thermoplasmata archaeon]|nr:GNAT family N-acetyltransferase [Thermoplasmata archaeon]
MYDAATLVGWCQFGPPGELPARMRLYTQFGLDPPEWRITCFFVDREHRGVGVAKAALDGALRLIAARGGGRVDAYPTEATLAKRTSSSFLWAGTVTMFADTGFRPLAALGKSKRVMRREVRAYKSGSPRHVRGPDEKLS